MTERSREKKIVELKELGRLCRGDILKMTTIANSGHPGGSMSSIDIFLSVFSMANIDPSTPDDPKRDRVIVSHGHTSPGVYSALARLGFFDIGEVIKGFRHCGSVFEGHVTRGIPGVEWTTGNLGQGLSAGVGMSIASKLTGKNNRVFVLMSDAEQAKGQVAEARRTAAKYGLNNLIVVIDDNNAQISGKAEDIMPVNIRENYVSDGWEIVEIDGHSYDDLVNSISLFLHRQERPVAIIARTTMGKGVSFMEDDVSYHGKPLSMDQCRRALSELRIYDDLDNHANERKLLARTRSPLEVPQQYPRPDAGEAFVYSSDKPVDNRSAFGKALADIGKRNRGKVPMAVIDCDLKPSTKLEEFEKECPESFFQIGVQEHNAAALAGALSTCGVLTFFADFGVFGIDETYNQQRLNDINRTNLKVAVTHVGLDVGEDGKTHHCIDYIGTVRNLPGFRLLVPADPNQTDRMVRYMASTPGNFAIVMGRSKIEPVQRTGGGLFFAEGYEFEYGKVDLLREGSDITLLTCGQVTNNVIKAADELKDKHGINASVIAIPTPLHFEFDEMEDLLYGKILVIEDHHSKSGLASTISIHMVSRGISPSGFENVGVDDYACSGSNEDLYELAGFSANAIMDRVKRILL